MLLSPQNTLCITLLCFFFSLSLPLPLTSLLSIAFLLSLSLSSALSPHLMRPHNNTAVVQLFCYLSQTAGSLHSVFLVPFTCLLRHGNEYHLEQRSTTKKKQTRNEEQSDIWGYTSKQHCVGIVGHLIKKIQMQRIHVWKRADKEIMFGGCLPLLSSPVQPGAVSACPRAPAFK